MHGQTQSTDTDRNIDVSAEDTRTRQAGRRERQWETLVTGPDTPSLYSGGTKQMYVRACVRAYVCACEPTFPSAFH